jgi:hypothetical protein
MFFSQSGAKTSKTFTEGAFCKDSDHYPAHLALKIVRLLNKPRQQPKAAYTPDTEVRVWVILRQGL